MDDRNLKGATAITGLGVTEQGKVYGHNTAWFAAEAIRLALDDAGLEKADIDGLLVNQGVTPLPGLGGIDLQNHLGLTNLRLLAGMQAGGATAGIMVQYAALAIHHGMADHVVCVFADAPLREGRGGGASYGGRGGGGYVPPGMSGLYTAFGVFGVNAQYALAARRHMGMYGTTNDHFGAIAVAQRSWAGMNPAAQQREPITIDDYHASRWVVEPLHLLDCCLISNGGVAVIVSSAERARDMKQPPAYIWGMGQGHPGDLKRAGWDAETQTGAPIAKERAFQMAGVGVDDIDVCQLYDCYTYTVLVTLEDYGFCPKGEGGPFVADGKLGPGGSLPTNTGGGQLSGFYMWGMTPLAEGIIQTRGQGGERQAEKNDVVLVSGNGGILDHHSTLVLSPQQA
ncbi:MAG: thiolase family protein [Chloroflexi bacterium]|nr:thiolase family protein [Chloroflexota bacterium]